MNSSPNKWPNGTWERAILKADLEFDEVICCTPVSKRLVTEEQEA